MAIIDLVNLDPGQSDQVRYLLGQPNWTSNDAQASPWVPNLVNPSRIVHLSEDQVIDVVILGDGYTDQVDFEDQLREWQRGFYAVEVYDCFRGCFRIRALYTESKEPASPLRGSYYRVPVDANAWCRGDVRSGNWVEGGGKSDEFRTRLFDAIETFDCNWRRYPMDLEVGSDPVIHNQLANIYSNLVVVMLVRTGGSINTSGRTRLVADTHNPFLSPPAPLWRQVNVAFGSYTIHEFGHAFAYLEDEYISGRRRRATRSNPSSPSLFTTSNLSFSDRLGEVPWEHLSPWGAEPRHAAGGTPSPVVGWLWRGGEDNRGVWHSEYRCLMNGRHKNYLLFLSDPLDESGEGANLRFRDPPRFCLWCQEIVAARILEKTGQLAADDDPEDIDERGRRWHRRWVKEWRPLYWQFFDLPGQIRERERLYREPSTDPEFDNLRRADGTYPRICDSDLYKPFMARPGGDSEPPAGAQDAEWLLLLG